MSKIVLFVSLFSLAASAQFARPPVIVSVTNDTADGSRLCAGMLAKIVGTNLIDTFGNVTVTVGNQVAAVQPVATNGLVYAQLPFTLPNGPTVLTVKNAGGSVSFGLNILPFAPAFYGNPAIVDSTPKGITPSNPANPGEQVVAVLVGLGPTNPQASITTTPPVTVPTTTLPTVTVGGIPAVVSSAVMVSSRDIYQVTFTIPDVVLRYQDVVVSAGGISSAPLAIPVGAATGGAPVITNVVNFADDAGGLSPGVLAAIVGQNLASSPSVSVGGKQAFIADASPTQLNVQLPVDLPVGGTQLTVTSSGQTTDSFNINISGFSPAFFTHGSFQSYYPFYDGSANKISETNPASPANFVGALLVGLGPTNPAVGTGQKPGGNYPTIAHPTLKVGGETVAVSNSLLIGTGIYDVLFTLPPDVPAGTQDVILSVGGIDSPPAKLIVANAPKSFLGFRNAANGQLRDALHGIAPNTFLSIYATNVGSADSQKTLFPSTFFLSTQVLFNGKPAPLYNVLPSADLINLVVPSELAETGTTLVTIISGGDATTENVILTMASTDVGVFRIPDPTTPARQIAAATVANTAQVILPQATAAAYKFAPCPAASAATSCAGPAHPGDSIVIFFTGGGKATPNGDANGNPVATGSVAPADGSVIYKTVLTPTLTIGGIPAPVLFSGIAPGTAAEYQINTVIPAGVTPGDDVSVVLSFEGSSDTVSISVQNP